MMTSVIVAAVLAVSGAADVPSVELIATCSIPADARDKSGLEDELGPVRHDRLGSMGSAIEWLGGDRFIMAADRGPADGAYDYATRVQTIRIALPDELGSKRGEPPAELKWSLEATTLLTREGKRLTGLSGKINRKDAGKSLRFDPEGIRVDAAGNWIISEEYGPEIRVFASGGEGGSEKAGEQIRVIELPGAFAISRPSQSSDQEDQFNSAGRVGNRGLEGLAISPDKKTITAIMQSPLLQDGGRSGLHIRMLQIDLASGKSKQFVYPLADSNYGCNEILAVDDTRFVVIERDGRPGGNAGHKAITLIDTKGATDVSEVATLPKRWLPADIKPVARRVLIDLLDDRFRLAGESFPEKIEGLTWGPALKDGRRTLWVTSDNDLTDKPNEVWVFAVSEQALK